MAANPTYPLFPIASIVSSALLLLILTTSFLRQSWNFGVSALCFGLSLANLIMGINSIIWADNADIKAEVYCDIVTHIEVFVSVLSPACSLAITRRLYKIAANRSVDMAEMSQCTKACDLLGIKVPLWRLIETVQYLDRFVEIFLIIVFPAIVTGLYYIIQADRFALVEGFGCVYEYYPSGVSTILLDSWPITLPLISMLFYIPKILWTFYRLKKETSQFLDTNGSLSRKFYMRILCLGCLDILFTLPLGIANLVISIELSQPDGFSFYSGWSYTHTDWAPSTESYAELQASGTWSVMAAYLTSWASVVLGYIIFALFGLTTEAKTMYTIWFYRVLGRSPPPRDPVMSDLVFGTQDFPVNSDAEQSSHLDTITETSLEEGATRTHLDESKVDQRQVQSMSQIH